MRTGSMYPSTVLAALFSASSELWKLAGSLARVASTALGALVEASSSFVQD